MPTYSLLFRHCSHSLNKIIPLLLASLICTACAEPAPKATPDSDPVSSVLPESTGTDDTNEPSQSNTPPIAALELLSPAAGDAPFTPTFDASASSDDQDSIELLEVRWDFDADGSWDTSFSTQKIMQHTYAAPGSYQVAIEVRDSGGLSSQATLSELITVRDAGTNSGGTNGDTGGGNNGGSILADIDGDSNRDGTITESDDTVEETWSPTSGVVFISNLDDDDNDGLRDGLDSELNGLDDLQEMTELVVRQIPDLSQDHTVEISVMPELARNYVRIFSAESPNNTSLLLQTEDAAATIPNTALVSGDLTLYFEGIIGRYGDFDGHVEVLLTVKSGGQVVSSDSIALRGAPIIFSDHTQPGTRFFLMRIPNSQANDSNLSFYNDVQDNLPSSIEFFSIRAAEYGYDRWVQDNMQTGYTQKPGPNGTISTKLHLETQRSQYPGDQGGLVPFLTTELLDSDLGYVYPQGAGTSLNYGGNLEVAPPHNANGKSYPFGRIVYGGGNEGLLEGYQYVDRMNDNQLSFLNAQEIQGPAIEVSSEWLAVGHIDEIFLFLKRNEGTGSPWVVAIASPTLARQRLQQAFNAGYGEARVFEGRGEYETTVEDLLFNQYLMGFNELAQARIDSIQEVLKSQLNLSDSDFIEVPVLFENYNGSGQAVALNPGVQNLVNADSVLFVPNPEGPVINGQDLWQVATRNALEPLGYEVRFVDVFYSYHVLMGEAHCGSNFERAPPPLSWWEEEE